MIKEFTIACSHTINTGNYSSLRVEASITVAVTDIANANEASLKALQGKAQVDLRTLLRETYEKQKNSLMEQTNERFGSKAK